MVGNWVAVSLGTGLLGWAHATEFGLSTSPQILDTDIGTMANADVRPPLVTERLVWHAPRDVAKDRSNGGVLLRKPLQGG